MRWSASLMFPIQKVSQASTGYSPLELIYGRHPQGVVDMAKETWEGETTLCKNVIDHISKMQDLIAAVMPLVREYLV